MPEFDVSGTGNKLGQLVRKPWFIVAAFAVVGLALLGSKRGGSAGGVQYVSANPVPVNNDADIPRDLPAVASGPDWGAIINSDREQTREMLNAMDERARSQQEGLAQVLQGSLQMQADQTRSLAENLQTQLRDRDEANRHALENERRNQEDRYQQQTSYFQAMNDANRQRYDSHTQTGLAMVMERFANAGPRAQNAIVPPTVVAAPAALPAPVIVQAAPTADSSIAKDGQSLWSQDEGTVKNFLAHWGDGAANRWVWEHNKEIGQ